jgi:3-oxoadipate enol-lactonase
MPHLQVNGATLWYEEHGSGPHCVVFAHGLLWSGEMFAAQVAALKDRYRCVTFDFRGQGRSEVTRGGYDMETLAEDAAQLIEALGCAPCHFVGLSMGGFAGMRLTARRPELIRSLTLLETSADPEPRANVPRYRALGLVGRVLGRAGFRLVAGRVMRITVRPALSGGSGTRGRPRLLARTAAGEPPGRRHPRATWGDRKARGL